MSFLSQYPGEDEVLIPPLSYLEVVGEPFAIDTASKGKVTVYPGTSAGVCEVVCLCVCVVAFVLRDALP